jgi:hypothetical protein
MHKGQLMPSALLFTLCLLISNLGFLADVDAQSKTPADQGTAQPARRQLEDLQRGWPNYVRTSTCSKDS